MVKEMLLPGHRFEYAIDRVPTVDDLRVGQLPGLLRDYHRMALLLHRIANSPAGPALHAASTAHDPAATHIRSASGVFSPPTL